MPIIGHSPSRTVQLLGHTNEIIHELFIIFLVVMFWFYVFIFWMAVVQKYCGFLFPRPPFLHHNNYGFPVYIEVYLPERLPPAPTNHTRSYHTPLKNTLYDRTRSDYEKFMERRTENNRKKLTFQDLSERSNAARNSTTSSWTLSLSNMLYGDK